MNPAQISGQERFPSRFDPLQAESRGPRRSRLFRFIEKRICLFRITDGLRKAGLGIPDEPMTGD